MSKAVRELKEAVELVTKLADNLRGERAAQWWYHTDRARVFLELALVEATKLPPTCADCGDVLGKGDLDTPKERDRLHQLAYCSSCGDARGP